MDRRPADIPRPNIALLGLLTAIDAMAIDSYVPALPSLQRSFDVTAASVQATLSIFFLGVAFGQAVWGPISDSYGRRRPILAGLLLFVAGSLLASLASGLTTMLIGRVLQALGASAALVLARAIVSDLWPDAQASGIYSKLMQILGFTALISPIMGGGLLLLGSWRWIFLALSAVGSLALLWTYRSLGESLDVRGDRPSAGFSSAYRALARNGGFIRSMAVSALAMGAMFAMLSGSSFLFIESYGWSSARFSLLYAATSVGFVAICQLNIIALARMSAARVLRAGLSAQLLCGVAFAALLIAPVHNAALSALLVIVVVALLGFILGNAVSEAMAKAPPELAGTASGAIGISQFLLSAAVMPLATIGRNAPVATALAFLGCAACASGLDLLRSRGPAIATL